MKNILRIFSTTMASLLFSSCTMMPAGYSNNPVQEHSFLGTMFDKKYDAVSAASAPSDDIAKRITRLRFENVMEKDQHGLPLAEKVTELRILREELIKRSPGWPVAINNEIRAGRVKKGMTKDQVIAAFGEPTAKMEMNEQIISNTPYLTAETKAFYKDKSMDTWMWHGDTQGYVTGHVRHFIEYHFGAVTFQNGQVYLSSATKLKA